MFSRYAGVMRMSDKLTLQGVLRCSNISQMCSNLCVMCLRKNREKAMSNVIK